MPRLTREKAERIAKAHACSRCKEYTYRRLTVRAATTSVTQELGAVFIATKTCGVCDYREEIGIAEDGDVVYAG